METKVVAGDVARIEADAVVVNLFEDVKLSGGAAGALDKLLDGAINSLINGGEIKGKFEEVGIVHTLGMSYSGLFGNDQAWIDRVLKAAQTIGERMWQMPVAEEYKEWNKSDIADVRNGGSRYGGAIAAALFLAEFVDKTPWVHIDIAGPGLSTRDSGHIVKGATVVGVRILVELALNEAKKREAI